MNEQIVGTLVIAEPTQHGYWPCYLKTRFNSCNLTWAKLEYKKNNLVQHMWNSQRLSCMGHLTQLKNNVCTILSHPFQICLNVVFIYYIGPAQGQVAQYPFYFALIFFDDLTFIPYKNHIIEFMCTRPSGEWLVVAYLLWLVMWFELKD